MLRIGLTGGMGSGKTTVANAFASYGVPVIDADLIAHELVKPGMPALTSIIKAFGDDFLNENDCLNRDKLRKLVFSDEGKRKKLESILHPAIRQEMEDRINKIQSAYCILVIPLLIETRQSDMVDSVLVVDVSKNTQIERIKNRDRLGEKEIMPILDMQSSREDRLKVADEVIINEGSPEDLAIQIAHLHQKFQQLADTPTG